MTQEELFKLYRNAKISDVDWLRSRHMDELALDVATTLSGHEYKELLDYVQALRDLPSHTSDYSNPTWPAKPSFIS